MVDLIDAYSCNNQRDALPSQRVSNSTAMVFSSRGKALKINETVKTTDATEMRPLVIILCRGWRNIPFANPLLPSIEMIQMLTFK
jgi:hypothetical protein